ncbi:NAD-dependent protein deacetylase sirtuin-1 isoform X1 [Bombus terrestris]|uniref:protein acetyllysine N-acetyltransferase n=2 Tax=Bombus terrestris TaxID=30195 RepID=A0A9B2MKF2_BOMTE|nr:NAD-dependent protein deacetylase sirtuin-1 isoform X1 [Bombus terrestris]
MASGSEVPEYSSPAKRRKVDGIGYNGVSCVKPDFQDCQTSHDTPNEDLEETYGGDSGFNELSDESKSASISPDATNLMTTPSRIDSTSDDTGCPIDTADEKDEVSSTVSNLSDLSGLSDFSGEGDINHQWRNASSWVQKQMLIGADPRDLLHHLLMDSTQIPEQVDDLTLWKIIINMMSEPPRRQKLKHINTLTDVVRLIRNSNRIIVLTGAGVSVSCGIPDFRSRDGIYSRLAQDFPDLPDPQAMFDINYFGQDPRPFYKFAREIYPGQFKPSPCHRFIKMLDKQQKLLRNYSQNIDTLEQVAGIVNVIECHGSFATASCTRCKYQVKADDIREDIFSQRIPLCPKCRVNTLPPISETNLNENYKDLVTQGIMKPDIVFFGEGLPDAFHDAMAKDKDECDLLIVIGSSLKVRPVALIPSSIPSHVPQILINRESLPHLKFDVELLGDGDIIINQLCHLMENNYKEVCWNDTILKEATQLLPMRHLPDDTWEQSQDTTSNTVLSRDSMETDFKLHDSCSIESQDSLMVHDNVVEQYVENMNARVSPFCNDHTNSMEDKFNLLEESPKRRLGESSVESSPKRMNFGSNCMLDFNLCSSKTENTSESSIDYKFHTVSVESTSKDIGKIYSLEECQVFPRIIEISSESTLLDSTLKPHHCIENRASLKINSDYSTMDSIEIEKMNFKPRQASIDSALDSGVGDSCNSVDSREDKTNKEELKNGRLDRHCWHSKVRKSLAVRLPENSYYQLAPGKYIFPGAEVYSDPEEYDHCSLFINSESSDSDSDSSSVEEEEEDEGEEEEEEDEEDDDEGKEEQVDDGDDEVGEVEKSDLKKEGHKVVGANKKKDERKEIVKEYGKGETNDKREMDKEGEKEKNQRKAMKREDERRSMNKFQNENILED